MISYDIILCDIYIALVDYIYILCLKIYNIAYKLQQESLSEGLGCGRLRLDGLTTKEA